MFKFKEGSRVTGGEGIHEGYSLVEGGLYGNISADRIAKLVIHFLRLQEDEVFFYMEIPCRDDEEEMLNRSAQAVEHYRVYYADGLAAAEAAVMFTEYHKLLMRDGLITFGFGSKDQQTELSLDKYNVFRIRTTDLSMYEQMLQEMGIVKERDILIAWDIIDEDHPGVTERVAYQGVDIYDLPEKLAHWGLYLAEIRAIPLDVDEPRTENEVNDVYLVADKLVDAGAREYQQGNFAEALAYYELAAEYGNVIAMSNLGYCYYYGRSVPVDYAKAAAYFAQAADCGDANALYKLGDMVGKHLLPDTEGTALDYYKKAFDLVKESKDPYSYPDICLRLARYNPPEKEFLLEEAVTYFKIRIKKGDNFTANVLRSAERELANCKKRS